VVGVLAVERRRAATLAAVALVVLLVVVAGSVGYYIGATRPIVGPSSTGSTTNTLTSSSITSATTRSSSTIPGTEKQQSYSLSQRETLKLGWSLDNSNQYYNSFLLVVYNNGEDSLTQFSYGISGVIGPFQGTQPIAAGGVQVFQVEFFGGLECPTLTYGPTCSSNSLPLSVNVTFSDGESFSIPQPILEVPTGFNPYLYNTNSPFCSSLLGAVSVTEPTLSGSMLTVRLVNTGSYRIAPAGWTLFDPLNQNGYRDSEKPAYNYSDTSAIPYLLPSVNPGSSTTVSQGFNNQGLIIGKSYSVWIQIGQYEPPPNSRAGAIANIVYAPGNFCTLTTTVQASS
jgi:hypothetical protein